MQVSVLGPLVVVGDDGALDVPGARLRALLVRLALRPAAMVPADALADALWGELLPGDTANALQSLVSRLRRLLPDGVLVSVPGGYRLEVAADDVDAARFETLAGEGRRALEGSDAQTAAGLLAQALELWRGPALADVTDAPFAATEADRLAELRLGAYEDLAEARLAVGDRAGLVAGLEALSAEHPLRERLRAALVRALYAAGRQADALAAYEATRRLLADELGVDPGPQLQAAQLAVLRGEDVPTAAVADRRAARTNLRWQLTSFVGRADEVERVAQLVRRHRLVTVVGPGGAGKTRLAVEVGRVLAPAYRNGVWLVELASVTDPDDLPQAVLGSLGLREATILDQRKLLEPRDAMGRLLAAVSDRDLLVVLDNCEHVIDAIAALTDQVLAEAPGVHILATSREGMGITGEVLAALPPLGQPAPGTPAAEAVQYASVQLFFDRAVAVRPTFVVDASTVGAVVEICRRLDGLPLAIELAAARLRSMSVDQVAARLGDRFRLLTGGSRTAVPRHRTLRAVVEWSWDLLSETERRVAERLAVFPAGATADAVAAVRADLDGEPVDEDGAVDVLAALVDKSLVAAVDADPPRYRMLETIREYGTERLVEAGHIAEVRAAQARWCRELAEVADPLLRTAEQLPWIARLNAERDNLLAALRFCVDSGDAEGAVRLGAALAWYWTLRGLHAEAVTWLGLALDVEGDAPAAERAIVAVAFVLSSLAGAPDPAAAARADELLSAVPEELRLGSHPVLLLGDVGIALFTDDTPRALAWIAKGFEHPDPWARATLRMMRGMVAENDGDVETMRTELAAAYDGYVALHERWGLGTTLAALGSLALVEGQTAQALAAFERSLRYMRDLDADEDSSHVLIRMALARVRDGDLDGARADLHTVIDSASDQRLGFDVAFATYGLAEVARAAGDMAESRRLVEDSLARMDAKMGPPQLHAIAEVCLAYVELAERGAAAARPVLADAYGRTAPVKDMPIMAAVAVAAATLALSESDPATAAELLGVARGIRGIDDRSSVDAERATAAARAVLGAEAYERHYAEGVAAERSDALARLAGFLGAGQLLRR